MNMHTREELAYRQALPLSMKVAFTKTRIRQWVDRFGLDGIYLSYSGGKDSTVLSHILDDMYPGNEIKRVFVDTGLEYPEIREFVKRDPRAVFLKPKLTFKQVIEKYGYPFISKETSACVYGARMYLTKIAEQTAQSDSTAQHSTAQHSTAQSCRISGVSTELAERVLTEKGYQAPCRMAMLLGKYEKNWNKKKKGIIPNEFDKSMFSQEKYKFFLDAPFTISDMCCKVMKKSPIHTYNRQTGLMPMTAQMASESRLRTQQWIKNGCNGFDLKNPVSNPMATWTEQDVLLYIKLHNVEICSVYGDIVTDYAKDGQLDGQVSLTDLSDEYGLFDLGNPPLKTTGCSRTGCMFCGYGCHLEKPGEGRFELMKKTHPKIYDYIMRPKEEGGLNYKEIIDWINEHGNLNIKY